MRQIYEGFRTFFPKMITQVFINEVDSDCSLRLSDCCEPLGIDKAQFSRYCSGTTIPSLAVTLAILDFFDYTLKLEKK